MRTRSDSPLAGVRLVVTPSVAGHTFVAELVEELQQKLTSSQVTGDPTVLLLAPGLASASDTAVIGETVQQAKNLVPIVLGGNASDALPELSQVLVDGRGASEVVNHIRRLMVASGQELVELQHLVAGAEQWEAGGRRPDGLLSTARVSGASALLAVAARIGLDDLGLLREFVAASEGHRRRRQRVLVKILVGASVVLLVLAILAAVSRMDAVKARDVARQQADTSTSSRLVRQVEEMLVGVPDPDLPHLLAAEALRAEPNPAAIDVARRVLDRTPAHQSVELPGSGWRVAAARDSSIVAVTLVDRRVVLVEGTSVLRTLDPPAGDTPVVPAVRPDGSLVALAGGDAVWFLDPRSQEAPSRVGLPAGTDAFDALWLAEGLVAFTDHGPFLVDRDGTVVEWGTLPWRDDVRAMDVIEDGRLVGLASPSHGAWIGDPHDGTPRWMTADTDVLDVTIGNADSVVLRRPRSFERLQVSAGELIREPYRGAQISLVHGPDGMLASLSRDGSVCHLDPTNGEWLACHPAHAGGAIDLAIREGGVVTVGFDRMLRLWEKPSLPRALNADLLTPVNQAMLTRTGEHSIGAGNQLVVSADGRRGGVFLPMIGAAVTFDPATWQTGTARFNGLYFGQYVAQLTSDARLLTDVRENRVRVMDLDSPSQTWEAIGTFAADGGLVGSPPQVATSADGLHVGYHRTGLALIATRIGVRTQATDSAQNPLANRIDDRGITSVIFGNGMLQQSDGPRVLLVRAPATVTAAAFDTDGRVVLVDSGGVVVSHSDGVRREVATLPVDFSPAKLRVSPDKRSIALMGGRRTLVLDVASGEWRLHLRAREAREVIQDVAFLPDGELLAIRLDGRLSRHPLHGSDTVRDAVTSTVPRAWGPDERALFGLED